jgi:spore germination cell wall hydrolase CwlJ-like protein
MVASRKRPRVARSATFGLSCLTLGLMPTQGGHQDLGALLARQPEVSQRWRAHVIASPFGSVQVAGFNFPRPIGTQIPTLDVRLASLSADDPDDFKRSFDGIPLPLPPSSFPEVNRRLKGDLLVARPPAEPARSQPRDLKPGRVRSVAFPRPGAEPIIVAAPTLDAPPDDEAALSEIDLDAAIASETVEFMTPTDDVAALNPDVDAIDDPDPLVRTARLYFGSSPIGDAVGPMEPWPEGQEPVLVMPPPTDFGAKRTAKAPAATPEPAVAAAEDDKPAVATPGSLAAPAETVAPKGQTKDQVSGLPKRGLSPSERLGLNTRQRARAEQCLAEAVYFEARGEPVRGQVAVAQVVMNRVFSSFYPTDVCGVVYQNAHRHLACQFTFACDNVKDVVREKDLWTQARQIARDTLDGRLWLPEIGKATHYHANYVNPWWVRTMRRHARIGVHLFYRPRRWGDGADEPKWGPGITVPETAAPTAQATPPTARM